MKVCYKMLFLLLAYVSSLAQGNKLMLFYTYETSFKSGTIPFSIGKNDYYSLCTVYIFNLIDAAIL